MSRFIANMRTLYVVLLALLLAVAVVFASPGAAFGIKAAEAVEYTTAIDRDQDGAPHWEEQNGSATSGAFDYNSIIVVYIPTLNWNDINPETMPILFGFAKSARLANLSAPYNDVIDELFAKEELEVVGLETGLSPNNYDAQLEEILNKREKSEVWVVGARAFAKQAADTELTPIIMSGDERGAYTITSKATRQSGLITGGDLNTYSINDNTCLIADKRLIAYDGSQTETTQKIIRQLNDFASTQHNILSTKPLVGAVVFALACLAILFGVVLLLLRNRLSHAASNGIKTCIVVLVSLVLSWPSATFLMMVANPFGTTVAALVGCCAMWTAVISLAVAVVSWRARWRDALSLQFALIVILSVLSQAIAFGWQAPGYLGFDITSGTRYYGMGNEQGAIMFGAWLALAALVGERARGSLQWFTRLIYPLLSLALLVIAAAPWWGASFGPLVWASFGCLLLWLSLQRKNIAWWWIAACLVAVFVLAVAVLYIDVTSNPLTHMDSYSEVAKDGIVPLVLALAAEAWAVSSNVTLNLVPIQATVGFAAVVALLMLARIFKPFGLREFWQRYDLLGSMLSISLGLAAITFAIEDSGVLTPGVLLICPVLTTIVVLARWLCDTRGAKESPPDLIPDGEDVAAVAAGPSLSRSTMTMSAATLFSRATGFLRTWALAFALGNTVLTSAYHVANTLPNLLFELFAGGALATAFLPVYMSLRERSLNSDVRQDTQQDRRQDAASNYASNLLTITALTMTILAVLAIIFAPQIIATQTFLAADSNDDLMVFFLRLFAVQIIFYGIGSIINSLLNAHRQYFWPALGPALNNIVVIVVLFGFPFIFANSPFAGLVWLGVGTTVGVIAMFAVQLPALLRSGLVLRLHINFRDPALRETLTLAAPAFAFACMSLVVITVMNATAFADSDNGPSTLAFAWLFFQLPYGIVAVSLSTTLLTEMSKAHAQKAYSDLRAQVALGLKMTTLFIIPLALFIAVFSGHLAAILSAGRFSLEDAVLVGQLLGIWCIALPLYTAYNYLYRVFIAIRELRHFIVIDILGRVVQIGLYIVFVVGVEPLGIAPIGLIGIPLADIITYTLLLVAGIILLHNKLGSFGLVRVIASGLKSSLAALVACIVPVIFAYFISASTILNSLFLAVFCFLLMVAVYLAMCFVLRIEVLSYVLRALPWARNRKVVKRLDIDAVSTEQLPKVQKIVVSEQLKNATTKLRIVALIAAYDEQATIASTIKSLASCELIDEVLVVDDGSNDATAACAEQAGAKVLKLNRNIGKGGALSKAIEELDAQGNTPDILLLADGDLGNSAQDIVKLIEPIVLEQADIATAALVAPEGSGGFGFITRLAQRNIAKHSQDFKPSTPLSGQRALNWRAVKATTPFAHGYGMEIAMTIAALRAGLKIVEVPTNMQHVATYKDLGGFVHRAQQYLDVRQALGKS